MATKDLAVAVELMADGLANVEEAAEYLSMSRAKVYQLMETGKLAYVKIGRSRRIPRVSLRQLAASCLVTA
jgi:excisionase family DNA binding protein